MADDEITTIADYLDSLPPGARDEVAEAVRRVRRAAPGAAESISYGMVTFRLGGGHPLYVAGWSKHLSLHDVPTLPDALEERVAPHRSGTDTVRFPYRPGVPHDLIEDVAAALAGGPGDR